LASGTDENLGVSLPDLPEPVRQTAYWTIHLSDDAWRVSLSGAGVKGPVLYGYS